VITIGAFDDDPLDPPMCVAANAPAAAAPAAIPRMIQNLLDGPVRDVEIPEMFVWAMIALADCP
jgi:hypothetical protein